MLAPLPASRFVRFAILVLAGWGVLTIAPDLLRVLGDYDALSFSADNDGYIYEVTPPKTGASDTVQPGDRIDLRRSALPDLLAVFGGMGGMQYVRRDLDVHLYICPKAAPVCSSATSELRHFKSSPSPLGLMTRLMLFADEILGMGFIGLAAVIVWQRANLMTWGFFLYALWFNPGQYFTFYAELQRLPWALLIQESAQAIFQGAGYAGFIIFALRFPHNTMAPRWRPIELAAPWIGGAIIVMQLIGFANVLGLRTETITRVAYCTGYAVDLLVLVILWLRARAQDPIDRQRTRWVLWGGAIGLLAFIFADSNMSTTMFVRWWPDPPEGLLYFFYGLNASVAVFVYHAIRRHRVIDVRFALSRVASQALTWVTLGLVLWWIFQTVEDHIVSLTDKLVISMPLFALLTLTKEYIHEHLNHLCDHLFFRRLYHAREKLGEIARQLIRQKRLVDIDRALVDAPVAQLELESAIVYRRRDDGNFVRAKAIGWHGHGDTLLSYPRAFVHRLAELGQPLRLLAQDYAHPPGVDAAPTLAVPILSGGHMQAVALYGAHRTGDDLNDEETALLAELGHAAGGAYGAVGLERLRKRIRELERNPKAAAAVPARTTRRRKPEAGASHRKHGIEKSSDD